MTKTNLSALIDAFGKLNAAQAELEIQEKAMKEALADLEAGSYEGELFRLNISESVRETPDKELAAQIKAAVEAFKATLSHQYLTAHIGKKNVRTHKLTARIGKMLAA